MSRSMQGVLFMLKKTLSPGFCASVATALALTLAASPVLAQAPKPPTFGTTATEVIVPVTATDSKGRFITDLVQSDFHIFDEGREQKIDFFSAEQSQPVVIGFL